MRKLSHNCNVDLRGCELDAPVPGSDARQHGRLKALLRLTYLRILSDFGHAVLKGIGSQFF